MKLVEHIQTLRKAQLQEYFLRWFPREEMTSDPDVLVDRLKVAMCDPRRIRERFDRLAKSSQDFLISLLTRKDYQGTLEDIRNTPQGQSIESYEVENLVKNLVSEGWIVARSATTNGVRSDLFLLPEEIGEGLSITVDVEYRDASVMLSLKAFLEQRPAESAESPGNPTLAALLEPAAIEERIAGIQNADLRQAVDTALHQHGGILAVTDWGGGSNGSGRLHRPEWREELEKNLLGTTGVLCLKSYGIDVEEECLVIFQEVVERYAAGRVLPVTVEHDRECSLGVDILTDIRRVLEIARSEALELTREGSVFKKTEERIVSELLSSFHIDLFEGNPIQHILGLCRRLRLLDKGDHFLRTDPMRRKIWLKKRLLSMVRSVFELYRDEYRGSRWSFHQRMIRDIFLSQLVEYPPETWLEARPLFTRAIACFLHALEDQHVSRTFRELQLEEFHNETLMVPLDRLLQDLSYWVVHRLALIGLVDLGFREGNFHSLQISSLGRRFFKLESRKQGEGKLVVNPDFEILLFPGGKNEEEVSYLLGAFADRTASERVKRYRIHPDSIKRAVIAGQTGDTIIEFLEKNGENSIPPNVTFSIREWAEGIEPILKQRVLLLRARTSGGADQVCRILDDSEIPHERVGEAAVVVRGVRNERKIREIQETFQNAGLFLE